MRYGNVRRGYERCRPWRSRHHRSGPARVGGVSRISDVSTIHGSVRARVGARMAAQRVVGHGALLRRGRKAEEREKIGDDRQDLPGSGVGKTMTRCITTRADAAWAAAGPAQLHVGTSRRRDELGRGRCRPIGRRRARAGLAAAAGCFGLFYFLPFSKTFSIFLFPIYLSPGFLCVYTWVGIMFTPCGAH